MSQPCRRIDGTTDEWAIETIEVPVPERYARQRSPLLVHLPCPPMTAAPPDPTEFECEVMRTAELARYMSVSTHSVRVRARRCAWGVAVATVVTVGTVAIPVAIWFGTVPVALAAGFAWQWAVLRAAANRLERDVGRAGSIRS